MAGQLPSKYNKQASGASFRAEVRRELAADLQRMFAGVTNLLEDIRDGATRKADEAARSAVEARAYLEQTLTTLDDIKARQASIKAYGDELLALSKKTGIQLASAKQLLAENRST